MLLTTVWIGLAGALLMFAGDMLLYYTPEDFSYSAKSSSEEKINAIIDVMNAAACTLPLPPCAHRYALALYQD